MSYWTVFQIILLIGAVQGIVLGVVLWKTDAPRSNANRFLSAILFFFAYRLITEVLKSTDLIGVHSWTYHVFLEYNWIYGSLIFFYVRSYVNPTAKLTKSDWIHFVPLLVEIIISNYVKAQNFFWDGTRESLSELGYHAYIFWMHWPSQLVIFSGLILFYVYRSRVLIARYTKEKSLPVQSEEIKWLDLLLKLYSYFALLVIIVGVVDYAFFDYAFNPFYLFPVYITMAVLTYWLGLQGFSRRMTPHLVQKSTIQPKLDHNWDHYMVKLKNVMEVNRLFANPRLGLQDLAEAIDLKPHQLTQILNRHVKKSFSQFVNQYRVEESIRLINSNDYQHYTLLAIAFESGFNSKASFNRIVKNYTGKSPKQLRLKDQ